VTARQSPKDRRQQLGLTLRRLREDAGLTIDQVAKELECSESKVSRIETGRVGTTPRDVRDMLRLYQVEDEQRDTLIEIAREARQRGWWEAYSDVSRGAAPYVGLEVAATSIQIYMALVVPSLLQTADYARAIIGVVRPDLSRKEVERRVDLRLKRQSLLDEDRHPDFWAILDEALLRRQVGGREVMRGQLDQLIQVALSQSVTIQVLPVTAGEHAGVDGPFTILRFSEPAEPDVVMLDSATGNLYLESAEDLHLYAQIFDLLRAAALSKDDSLAFISALADEV
jgi:transcriptional regulator with XRE-family HTH domain